MKKIIFLLAFLLSSQAFGFKVDTHVWIAQQVINDLKRNPKALNIASSIVGEIDEAAAQDILRYPAYFRMGAIGPDAYPGVLEGQTIIHPGADDKRWGTGEWLKFLMSRAQPGKERAFVLGFICHAASDMFAHTYINTYSGGEFILENGTEEEERHFTLEAYISEHNPKILDENGNSLGMAYQLVMDGKSLAVPVDFVLNNMLYDHTARDQYERKPSRLFGAMQTTKENIDNFLKPNGPLDQMEAEIIRYIVAQETGIELNRKQAAELNRLAQEAQKYNDKTAEGLKKLIEFTGDVTGKVQDVQDKVERKQIELLQESTKAGLQLAQQSIEVNAKILQYTQDLAAVVIKECSNACSTKELREKVCSTSNPAGCLSWVIKISTVLAFPAECATCQELERSGIAKRDHIQGLLDKEREIYNQTQKQIEKTFDKVKKAHDDIIKARLATLKIAETLALQAVEQARIATSTDPFREILKSWSKNIDLVGREYILANGQVIVNTINPNATDKFAPLMNWLQCQLPKAAGIPGVIPDTTCAIDDYIGTISIIADNLKNTALGSIPIVKDVLALTDRLKELAKNEIKKEAISQMSTLLKIDIQQLIDIVSRHVDDQVLDATFSDPRHRRAKGLILFDRDGQRISDRVKAEMHLTAAGTFDPARYQVVKDAVALSKLALLDGNKLQVLLQKLNVQMEDYDVESLNAPHAGAVLVNAIRSIDGNHQWLHQAPPMPKARMESLITCRAQRFSMQFQLYDEFKTIECPSDSGYDNYSIHYATTHGFRLYYNKDMRARLFNVLFAEILAPGIEAPKTLNPLFDEVLPTGYPYRVCAKVPFPSDDPNDPTCVSEVVKTQLAALYGSLQVPPEVIEVAKEKVQEGSYTALKPLFDYEAIHYQFKAEDQKSIAEWQNISRQRAAWMQERDTFNTIQTQVAYLSEGVLNDTVAAASAEAELLQARKTLRANYCDGRMYGYRDIQVSFANAMVSYGQLKYKTLVQSVDFQDFEYFAGKASESVKQLEDRYEQIRRTQTATQDEFAQMAVDQVCHDIDVVLLHIGARIDAASIANLDAEVKALKDRLANGDKPANPNLNDEELVQQIQNNLINSLTQKKFVAALDIYVKGLVELERIERGLASPQANFKALTDAIKHAREVLDTLYNKNLSPAALTIQIKREHSAFIDNNDLIPMIADQNPDIANAWKDQVAQEPEAAAVDATLKELVIILQYYTDSNALAEKLLEQLGT